MAKRSFSRGQVNNSKPITKLKRLSSKSLKIKKSRKSGNRLKNRKSEGQRLEQPDQRLLRPVIITRLVNAVLNPMYLPSLEDLIGLVGRAYERPLNSVKFRYIFDFYHNEFKWIKSKPGCSKPSYCSHM